jgi:hypothetical protein
MIESLSHFVPATGFCIAVTTISAPVVLIAGKSGGLVDGEYWFEYGQDVETAQMTTFLAGRHLNRAPMLF